MVRNQSQKTIMVYDSTKLSRTGQWTEKKAGLLPKSKEVEETEWLLMGTGFLLGVMGCSEVGCVLMTA